MLASLDLENAFNSLDRHEILDAPRELMPSLAPWVDWCYGEDSMLVFDSVSLPSQRGVQQGDPLGPLLFSLALQRAALRVKQRAPPEFANSLDFTVFYLDDAFIAGRYDAVRWFCGALQEELSTIWDGRWCLSDLAHL